jgi:hypothetical protein
MSVHPYEAFPPKLRDVLIDHMDGQLIRYRMGKDATAKQRITHWATRRAVNHLRETGHLASARWGYTAITEKGRKLLSKLLAHYADQLMVGYDDKFADALLRAAMVQNAMLARSRVEEIKLAATLGGALVDEAREVAEAEIHTESV